jgi:hypothetical protein
VDEELSAADQALREAFATVGDRSERESLDAQRQLLLARKDAVRHAVRDGVVTEDEADAVLADLDARLLRVMDGESEL